jgi:glycosyltransferase involved in cell wall biosynthesis
VLECARELLALPAQLVVLGSGDAALQEAFQQLARSNPKRVGVQVGYDESLAHQIEAGADLFLMPSRFEPCGLNQMYSQRYGTPPVVHATGGLVDSVVDATKESMAAKTVLPVPDDLGGAAGGVGRCCMRNLASVAEERMEGFQLGGSAQRYIELPGAVGVNLSVERGLQNPAQYRDRALPACREGWF